MKIDPYCQQQNTHYMYFSATYRLPSHSSARGASNNVEVAKQVFIHIRLSRAYLALARLSNRYSCCFIVELRSDNFY